MSLSCDLTINRERIGSIVAVRADCGQGTDPEAVNTYDAVMLDPDRQSIWQGRVWHRYGDGAWALVAAVIDAMADTRPEVSSNG